MGGTIAGTGATPTLPTAGLGANDGTAGLLASRTSAPLEAQRAAGAPPIDDLATALANLSGALDQLSAALDAMKGAAQVTGGGGAGASGGCRCAHDVPTQQALAGAQGSNPAADAAAAAEATMPTAPATAATPAAASGGGGVRDRIVQLAEAELAKNVRGGANRNVDAGGNIARYASAVTGPGEAQQPPEAWCADFASWIWREAGSPFGPNGQGEDHTVAMVKHAQSNGSWKTSDPKPGDLVLIDWDGGRGAADPSSVVDHVAIVTKVENGRVHTIGGNEGLTESGVRAADYAVDDPKFLGFVTPAGG